MSLTRCFSMLKFTKRPIYELPVRLCTTQTGETKTSGYAKAFEKFDHLKDVPKEEPKTFAALLRNSKFIDVSFTLIWKFIVLFNIMCS